VPDSLGEFEHLVLLALLRLEPDECYGMKVRDEIVARAGRRVAIGAVYATLDRLEKKALVNSRNATAAETATGRARRFFSVTAAGKRAIRDSQKALRSMSDGLDLRLA
jgi:PadR family transcriptional regulator PadR